MKGKDSNDIQNQFTAYLSTAVKRRRNGYIIHAMRQQQRECLMDEPVSEEDYDTPEDIPDQLPVLMQLENNALLQALKGLNERERRIFLARALEEKPFSEIAKEVGIGCSNTSSVYYRVLHKIRDQMMGAGNEF